jgi:hypothetical protein
MNFINFKIHIISCFSPIIRTIRQHCKGGIIFAIDTFYLALAQFKMRYNGVKTL